MSNPKNLIIFGTGKIAELARYYFCNDTDYKICAFTVEDSYISAKNFLNLPVVRFSEVKERYPSSEYSLFIAISYAKCNEIRRRIFEKVLQMGYHCPSYISPNATVLNNNDIGSNCFILEGNVLQPYSKVGDNVTLWSGNHLGHHSIIEDHCFISSHVVISGGVNIGKQTFIGVNSTLRDGINIGEKCVIGAGSLILNDTDPGGVYIGSQTQRSKVPSSRLRRI